MTARLTAWLTGPGLLAGVTAVGMLAGSALLAGVLAGHHIDPAGALAVTFGAAWLFTPTLLDGRPQSPRATHRPEARDGAHAARTAVPRGVSGPLAPHPGYGVQGVRRPPTSARLPVRSHQPVPAGRTPTSAARESTPVPRVWAVGPARRRRLVADRRRRATQAPARRIAPPRYTPGRATIPTTTGGHHA